MWRFNPLGGLIFTAKTLQKPTPAWQQNHAAFYVFGAVTFTPTSFQNLRLNEKPNKRKTI